LILYCPLGFSQRIDSFGMNKPVGAGPGAGKWKIKSEFVTGLNGPPPDPTSLRDRRAAVNNFDIGRLINISPYPAKPSVNARPRRAGSGMASAAALLER
jgi:hypothetical protein